tara:strand:+ start:346 stop:738 length:393 start_codon:yes stop_codon:yes gene_type:complete
MNIDELKRTLDSLTSDLDNIENGDSLYTIENNSAEIGSYADYMQSEVRNAQRAIGDVRTELNCIVDQLDKLEGLDVEKVKAQAFREIGDAIRDLVALQIDRIISQAVSAYEETDEPKKEPAKKSTETDNQ